jgi:hypothetical protein
MTNDAIQTDGAGSGIWAAISVPLTPGYVNPYVNINPTTTSISLPLTPGPHVLTTPLQNVGSLTYFANPTLQASLSVWYNYDPLHNTLTFCSNDLVSGDSTYVLTVPAGTNQGCRQHTYPNDNIPCGNNPNWNYCTPTTPGLQGALQQTVRSANQAIINAARAQGFTVIVRTPFPTLTVEEYTKLMLVYHQGRFLELYNPEKTYDADHTLVHPESVWLGEIYLDNNDTFANVIGSTNDPKINNSSWLGLWQSQFGTATVCTSLNFNGFTCGPGLLGGHVILGQTALQIAAGSGGVFIMPICVAHNNNDNVYMAPLQYEMGIALQNYLQ